MSMITLSGVNLNGGNKPPKDDTDKISQFYQNGKAGSNIFNAHPPNRYMDASELAKDKKTYYAELDYMCNYHDDQKHTDNIIKSDERVQIDVTADVMNSLQKELNNEDKKFKQAMGKNYIKEMAEHKRRKLEDKLRTINEDNVHLKQVEKAAQEEKFRNTITKNHMKTDQDIVLQLKQDQKQKENQLKESERSEYNKMVEESIQKELIKENEYKKFYDKYENKHKNRIQKHQEYISNNPVKRYIDWGNEHIRLQDAIASMPFSSTNLIDSFY